MVYTQPTTQHTPTQTTQTPTYTPLRLRGPTRTNKGSITALCLYETHNHLISSLYSQLAMW